MVALQVGGCLHDIAAVRVKAALDSFCLGLEGSWFRLLFGVEEEADWCLLLKP